MTCVFLSQWLDCLVRATCKNAIASTISIATATKMPSPAWPLTSSEIPRTASSKQATTAPLSKAERAGDGAAFLALRNMTPIPAYRAAPRRLTKPAWLERSTPQLDSSTPGASIQVSARAKKMSADRIATLRKLIFIVVNEPGLMLSSAQNAVHGEVSRHTHALTSTTVRPWTFPSNNRSMTAGTSARPTRCVVRASLPKSRSRASRDQASMRTC